MIVRATCSCHEGQIYLTDEDYVVVKALKNPIHLCKKTAHKGINILTGRFKPIKIIDELEELEIEDFQKFMMNILSLS